MGFNFGGFGRTKRNAAGAKVTRRGFGSNLLNSVIGVFIGFLVLIGSVCLLFYNEVKPNAADAARDATELTAANAASLEGEAVWVKGELTAGTTVNDTTYIKGTDFVYLVREVEMYAWIEEEHTETQDDWGGGTTTTTTYTYKKQWTRLVPNSVNFDKSGHDNPPKDIDDKTLVGDNLAIAGYSLGGSISFANATVTFAPTTTNINEGTPSGKYIYLQSTAITNPAVGDYRLSYYYILNNTEGIVLGKLSGTSIVKLEFTSKGVIKTSSSIYRFFNVDTIGGVISMLSSENKTLLWVLRIVGTVAMLVGFLLLFGPIQAIAGIIPFLKKVTGAIVFVIALALTLVLSFLTILIANILNNWISLIAMIAVVVLLMTFGVIKARKKKAQEALNTSN